MTLSLYDSIVRSAYCTLPTAPLVIETSLFVVLANLGLAIAYFVIGSILIWLMTQSVLIRRTQFFYILVVLMYSGSLGHLVSILAVPDTVHVVVKFINVGVALIAMASLWRQKHYLLRIVFQFKYTMGLLKNLDLLDTKKGEEK